MLNGHYNVAMYGDSGILVQQSVTCPPRSRGLTLCKMTNEIFFKKAGCRLKAFKKYLIGCFLQKDFIINCFLSLLFVLYIRLRKLKTQSIFIGNAESVIHLYHLLSAFSLNTVDIAI